jgi:hypothetical protein
MVLSEMIVGDLTGWMPVIVRMERACIPVVGNSSVLYAINLPGSTGQEIVFMRDNKVGYLQAVEDIHQAAVQIPEGSNP